MYSTRAVNRQPGYRPGRLVERFAVHVFTIGPNTNSTRKQRANTNSHNQINKNKRKNTNLKQKQEPRTRSTRTKFKKNNRNENGNSNDSDKQTRRYQKQQRHGDRVRIQIRSHSFKSRQISDAKQLCNLCAQAMIKRRSRAPFVPRTHVFLTADAPKTENVSRVLTTVK